MWRSQLPLNAGSTATVPSGRVAAMASKAAGEMDMRIMAFEIVSGGKRLVSILLPLPSSFESVDLSDASPAMRRAAPNVAGSPLVGIDVRALRRLID